jgi:hypothetical protein
MYAVNRELVERLSIAPDAFTGQTAVVTGGARGIGEATATTLAALGARVVVIDRLPAGEDVAAAIRAAGGDAVFKMCDISDVDQLSDAIADIGETVGPVDILVNNALHARAAPVVSLELEDWEKTFATNARAPFLLTKAMLPGMLERHRGVVVNMVAYEGSPLAAAYSGTKSALRSLATTVAREIGNESGSRRLPRHSDSRRRRRSPSSPTTRATTGSCRSTIARRRSCTRSHTPASITAKWRTRSSPSTASG